MPRHWGSPGTWQFGQPAFQALQARQTSSAGMTTNVSITDSIAIAGTVTVTTTVNANVFLFLLLEYTTTVTLAVVFIAAVPLTLVL